MIKIAIVGLGKMGISHFAILNMLPDVDIVGVCDSSPLLSIMFAKNTKVKCFKDYREMIKMTKPDCLVVATPTVSHAEIVRYALENNLHVFCEKPFCLNVEDGPELIKLAVAKNLVNQVGYHCRFVGVFNKVKHILSEGHIGKVYYFHMEVYGNVVKKEESKTWRSQRSEGGGCLYDYASHGIDLVNFLIGKPDDVRGVVLPKINSKALEDAVYATLLYENGVSGQLSINWCDPTFRKMSNQITIMGTNGKIIADRQECKVYINKVEGAGDFQQGWNLFYTTDTTRPVKFYLRGEEYSAQLECFVNRISQRGSVSDANISSFESAFDTDMLVHSLIEKAIAKE